MNEIQPITGNPHFAPEAIEARNLNDAVRRMANALIGTNWENLSRQRLVDLLIETSPRKMAPTIFEDQKSLHLEIKTLPLSSRCRNALLSEWARYIGDLIQYSENDLSKYFIWIGQGSLQQIKAIIGQHWLTLGTSIPNWGDWRKKE